MSLLLLLQMMLLINVLALLGMFLNLLLYAVDASVVMDDLIDALVKVTARIYSSYNNKQRVYY